MQKGSVFLNCIFIVFFIIFCFFIAFYTEKMYNTFCIRPEGTKNGKWAKCSSWLSFIIVMKEDKYLTEV